MTNAVDSKRESILSKVRKILDRAEGTDHQGEIDTALALAQRLMAEYAIEQAEVDKLKDNGAPEQIVERAVEVGPFKSPSSTDKGCLGMAVAENNRCQVFRTRAYDIERGDRYMLNFVGYESDVEFAEMLWTSLCLQMEQAHNKAKKHKRDWVNGRTFRKNFNQGFISEARARLDSMKVENERQIEETKGCGTALVLRDREKDVATYVKAKHKLRRGYSGRTTYDGHARQEGAVAGRKADYSGGTTKRIGSRGQLTTGS